ncbi:MAG: class A beta-lactamase-related serine hydrolase [Lactobacillales bacterium]|jgi:beta-lactamase class A|nr:class A beta-lactamase-related serine hydrolase [Lactobacillales bacterium]
MNLSKVINDFISHSIIFAGIFMGCLIFEFSGNPPATETNVSAETTLKEKTVVGPIPDETVAEAAIKTKQEEELVKFTQKIQRELQQIIFSSSGEIGVTYVDLTSNQRFDINGKQKFFAASTNKVPLVMRISELVKAGKLTWDMPIKYEADDFENGTGILQGNIQPTFTVHELANYAIVYSDNVAKNMLMRQLAPTYETALENIYQTYLPNEKSLTENLFSTNDLATILEKLYKEKSQIEGYQELYQNMKQTIFHNRLETPLTQGHIAHKIGSNEAEFNDIGIFEGNHPFILTVSTNHVPDAESLISKLADSVWRIQEGEYPAE